MKVTKDFTGEKVDCNSLNTQTIFSPGSIRVYEYSFSYDTPNLNLGVTVLDMEPGDTVIDAWTVTTETFNGTNLFWDIGTFNPNADQPTFGFMAYWWQTAPTLSDFSIGQIDYIQNDSNINSLSSVAISYATQNNGDVYPWQTKFVTFSTLKFVLSQTGQTEQAAIGGTQGKATLYIQVSKANP